jgi:hypothetical protein
VRDGFTPFSFARRAKRKMGRLFRAILIWTCGLDAVVQRDPDFF